ncbi:MAG: hypothetical protein HUU21_01890 [Polyangiaceae bacterium]|nr:hypothetical protein [Polyangiaceae bacterium]
MRRSALTLLVLAVSATLFAPARSLGAELHPSLDLRGFRPSTDPASGLYLEPASSPASLDWNVGLWLSYAYKPITLRDAATDEARFDVIRHQLTGDLTAGVGIGKRAAIGLDLPFLLAQSGEDPASMAAASRILGPVPLPENALGDFGITGKLTIVRPTRAEFGGFALALHERLTVPMGDEASYLGEGNVTSETRILTEYRLIAIGVHAALGVKLRGDVGRYACEDIPEPKEREGDACPTRFGHEIPFGMGVSFRPQILGLDDAGRWTWFLEMRGHVPLAPTTPFSSGSGRVSAAAVGAGARVALGDVSILAGLEGSVIGAVGGAPVRALLSVGWAPREHDADNDGIEDKYDQCPELAEDKDRFEDDDGCPDGDNDDDGVPDGEDQCATEREDEDGFEDEDGCIDPDNDGDKILDVNDTCPNEAGLASPVAAKNGCPERDPDGDGLEGSRDQCPEAAEDKDGFEDDDGCPELDNDTDGIPDTADACPLEEGIESPNPKERGCPDPDKDKDTFAAADDKCVSEGEVWNGLDDGDGCPDGDPKKNLPLLVEVKEAKEGPSLRLSAAVKFTDANEVDAASDPLLRAVASELMKHPEWTVLVGVRPRPKGGAEEAKARASAVAAALVRYSRREKAAEAGGWDEVKDAPGAVLHGIGLKVRAPKAAEKKAGAAEKRQPEPTEKKAPEGAKAPAPKKP